MTNRVEDRAVARPAIEVRGVTVRRGDVEVVAGLDWRHTAGSVAWLVGPNGVGKSSLMGVLAGLTTPAAGSVRREIHLGDSVTDVSGDRTRVGFYEPAMSLPPEARAGAFARLSRRLVADADALVPERELGRKRARHLSTGEEKRLLLGPVLTRGRDFLFLDEPYEHLSAGARATLTALLRELALRSVVVVATNQPLPEEEAGPVLRLEMGGAHVR